MNFVVGVEPSPARDASLSSSFLPTHALSRFRFRLKVDRETSCATSVDEVEDDPAGVELQPGADVDPEFKGEDVPVDLPLRARARAASFSLK